MGMRWRAVIVKAADDDVRAIAVSAQQLIPCLKNQIDASIVSLRSPAVPTPWVVLQMFHFVDRPPEITTGPACLAEAFVDEVFQSGPGFDIRAEIAKEPHVALAILASRMRGDATFVVCSDTLCCSGHLHFSNGTFMSGSIYGWEGSEELWSFSSNSFHSEKIELTGPGGYNYYKPVADGLIQAIGPGTDELFLSPTGGGTEGQWLRYHILTKRQPISPVVAKPEHAESLPTDSPAVPQNPSATASQASKRPWWKFW